MANEAKLEHIRNVHQKFILTTKKKNNKTLLIREVVTVQFIHTCS